MALNSQSSNKDVDTVRNLESSSSFDEFENEFLMNDSNGDDSNEILSDDEFATKKTKQESPVSLKSSKNSKEKELKSSKNQSFQANTPPESARKKLSFVNIDFEEPKESPITETKEISAKKTTKTNKTPSKHSQIPSCYNRPPSSRRHIEEDQNQKVNATKRPSNIAKTKNIRSDLQTRNIHQNDVKSNITKKTPNNDDNPANEIKKRISALKNLSIKSDNKEESSPTTARIANSNLKKEYTPISARKQPEIKRDQLEIKKLPISQMKSNDKQKNEVSPTTARPKTVSTARQIKDHPVSQLKRDKVPVTKNKIESNVPSTSRVPSKQVPQKTEKRPPQTARNERPKPIISVLDESIMLRKQCAKDFCDDLDEVDAELDDPRKTGIDWLDDMAENEEKLMLNFDAERAQEDSMLNLYEAGASKAAQNINPNDDPFDNIMKMMNAGFDAIHQQSMRDKELLDERIMLIQKIQEQLKAEPPIDVSD
ncbi:hypothetical protein TVAG_046730 [Trichomonas vaginalis G3]|uniref:Uncharacterized protein n=1 Tax=Trichomonas vaginalis (strain ATCC PRA-98 / G3) TaxID=412133 RepID=A2EAP8_TRIV3|nr:hypothetical protein TVAGG3_0958460 [Trichomonas vaginalis G3]EAY10251.1 hypothetical protein TVAG_046730 [Trichomonas vaginalis G3]KAI5487733.1 hypothetical protein TVAGG3_0958460 [Trichomonas vaginalis G3]|eukprot:XP_001322474.1 hypothetical protein [Trichomonas vaginalis G3]